MNPIKLIFTLITTLSIASVVMTDEENDVQFCDENHFDIIHTNYGNNTLVLMKEYMINGTMYYHKWTADYKEVNGNLSHLKHNHSMADPQYDDNRLIAVFPQIHNFEFILINGVNGSGARWKSKGSDFLDQPIPDSKELWFKSIIKIMDKNFVIVERIGSTQQYVFKINNSLNISPTNKTVLQFFGCPEVKNNTEVYTSPKGDTSTEVIKPKKNSYVLIVISLISLTVLMSVISLVTLLWFYLKKKTIDTKRSQSITQSSNEN